MGKNILVKDVPESIDLWIEKERRQRDMSQQDFILTILQRARESGETLSLPFMETESPLPGNIPFKFIDLFAGIGGFRIALEKFGGRCVFSSEWDAHAQKTYKEWFGEIPRGDIRKIKPSEIPDHDLMAAGFPCQPFSIAGVSKKKSRCYSENSIVIYR